MLSRIVFAIIFIVLPLTSYGGLRETEADTVLISHLMSRVENNEVGSQDSVTLILHRIARLLEPVKAPQYRGRKSLLLGIQFYRNDVYDSAILYTERAVSSYKLTGLEKELGKALINLGSIRVYLDRSYEKAVEELQLGIRHVSNVGDYQLMTSGYRVLAYAMGKNGDNNEAIKLLDEGIEKIRPSNNPENLAPLYLIKGGLLKDRENYPGAMASYLEGKNILEKYGNHDYDGEMNHNIGLVYMRMEQLDSSMHYLRLGYQADPNRSHAIPSFEMFSFIFEDWGQYDSAIYYMKEAVEISEEFDIQCSAIGARINLANLYIFTGDYDAARLPLEESFELIEACEQYRHLPFAMLENGRLNYHQGNYRRTISISNDILSKYTDPEVYMDIIADAHAMLYDSYKALGKFELALKHHEIAVQWNDSLINQDKIREVARLEEQYRYKKEKDLLLANQETERIRLESEKESAQSKQRMAIIATIFIVIIASGVFWAFLDRRKKSRQLALLNQDLNRTNEKLKALDDFRIRFFANINHDFRSPLTLIKGYVDRMAANKTNFLSKETEEDMLHLRENADMLVNMTGQIQNLIKLDEGKLSVQWNEIKVVSVISSIHKMYDSLSDVQGKRLELLLEADEFVIHADLGYFRKILYNLISNAFRYTSTGAVITIEVRNTGAQAEIRVRDTGQGIDAEHLPHIFDRFYQVPDHDYKSVEGFGIGLALVKELVELHEGSIEVESEPGAGTTFTLMLPHNLDKPTVAPAEEPVSVLPQKRASATTRITNPPISNKEHTLLVVDDHDEIRQYIWSSLQQIYEIRQAVHGKEALEILEKEKIDLIITDLMMPWLDGFDLIDEVRQNEKWQHIPVMVVSARTTEEDKLKVLDAGVNDFIAKPFDLAELVKKVENHIGTIDTARKNTWQAVAENKDIRSNLERNILKKINQLIIDRIEDPGLRVEDIAEEISASQRKTFNLLKSLTGQSPQAYIKNVRLDYAHQLIISDELKNAAEAARAIGMKNSTHFKKQYLEKFGIVPFGETTHLSNN